MWMKQQGWNEWHFFGNMAASLCEQTALEDDKPREIRNSPVDPPCRSCLFVQALNENPKGLHNVKVSKLSIGLLQQLQERDPDLSLLQTGEGIAYCEEFQKLNGFRVPTWVTLRLLKKEVSRIKRRAEREDKWLLSNAPPYLDIETARQRLKEVGRDHLVNERKNYFEAQEKRQQETERKLSQPGAFGEHSGGVREYQPTPEW